MTKEIRFEFETSRLEVYKDDQGKSHVRGIASDTLEDRQGDVITESCIGNMAKQVSRGIPLLPDHRASFEIGMSTQGDSRRNASTNGLELVVDFELDDRFTEAKVLYGEVETGKCRRQMSIGGFLNKLNPRAAYLEERNGKMVTVLDDINLDHIAVTREGRAANPRTAFIDAVFKAIDEAGIEITKDGLVERQPDGDLVRGVRVPEAVTKLGTKQIELWASIWKDTFIRQLHVKDQTVESAEASATGVAAAILSKQLGQEITINPDEYVNPRTSKETYVIGTTSKGKGGHTHLWIGKEIGEKIIDGLMLTVKGHGHKILENGTCDSDSDHEHTLVRKDKKVAEPSTELSAPVGLLHFGKGYDSEDDVRTWLDSKGIEPLSITRMAKSMFVVEFSLPVSRMTEGDEAANEEGAEMPKNKTNTDAEVVEKATVPYKAWPMSQERSWSWAAADGNQILGADGNNWTRFKAAHTYYDEARGTTPEIKGAYSLPHHKSDDGGLSTYIGGVIAATAILNGARGGFRRETSEGGRRSLYNHLTKHYAQAERTPPPLKSDWVGRIKEDFEHPNPKTLAERDFEDFVFALEQAGFKDQMPEFLNKEWWMTWDPEQTGTEEIPEKEKGIWTPIEKATVEDAKDQEPVAGEQEIEADSAKDDKSGTNDDNATSKKTAEVAKAGDDSAMTGVQAAVAELAEATKKALSEITSTVCDIGKRVAALESSPSKEEPKKEDETPAEEKPAEEPKAEEKPAEEPKAETANTETATEKPAEENSSDAQKSATAQEFFTAFHNLLEGMGMTAKDFMAALVQKNLDGAVPDLTKTVQKAVESSVSSLQKGVIEKVEKSLDAKLTEAAKDFGTAIEKLNGRLEKVEQVGGVPGGAAGQESTSDSSEGARGVFAGIFSRAVRPQ